VGKGGKAAVHRSKLTGRLCQPYELANRASAGGDQGTDISNLPKIEGTPSK
jgi:hypothetical protein